MKIAIIINSSRITSALQERLNSGELTEKYNISYDIFIAKPQELESVLRSLNHQTYNAYLVGGGDGSIRTAAEVLIDCEIPLAILPLGTFNFLARELNHPNDIDAVFAMIKNNKIKQIDLAEVNGHIFINHSWVGFYANILKLREKYKNILGTNRLLKTLFNAMNLFKPLPIYRLQVVDDNESTEFKTCLIYIGNNDHQTNFLNFGDRKTLSSGLLSVNILNCKNRWDLFKCLGYVILNKFKDSKYLTQFNTSSVIIDSDSKSINIVIDGELIKLDTPLRYIMHKKHLNVMIP